MEVGMTHEMSMTVEPHMTASSMKSGALAVFATPIMIAMMENVCMECVAPSLPAGQSTVGTRVDVTHEAPTPVGAVVRFACTLREIDRRRLVFDVTAYDGAGVIGRGMHERFIVDSDKFEQKCRERGA
ncbi:MAG: thioesterase [Clostridia bacterium]|nr:thioesterase [Clostridia bacterium]